MFEDIGHAGSVMTKLLEEAFEALGRMPADAQDDIARALIGMADAGVAEEIEAEHLAAVMEGMAQADRGEFAAGNPNEIVAAAFRRADR